MITIYIGLPGSGKTTLAAKHARQHIKKGIKVYSNVDIDGCYSYEEEDLGRYMIVDGCLILDEAGISISNRAFMDKRNKTTDKEARAFWKKYRHNGIDDVYIFSQAFDFDITLRRLADKMYIVKKSLLPNITIIKSLKPYWDVDDQGQPTVKWKITPLFFRILWRRPYYKYFNSFDRDILPEKDFPLILANYDRRSFKNKLLDHIENTVNIIYQSVLDAALLDEIIFSCNFIE